MACQTKGRGSDFRNLQQSKPGVAPGPDTDVTRPRPGFDLAAIKRDADSKQVRLWTWVHQAALRGRVEEASTSNVHLNPARAYLLGPEDRLLVYALEQPTWALGSSSDVLIGSYCVETRTKPWRDGLKTDSGMGMVLSVPSPATFE